MRVYILQEHVSVQRLSNQQVVHAKQGLSIGYFCMLSDIPLFLRDEDEKQLLYYPLANSIQILTALKGTVNIIGPRWCQNHDYARSEALGIVMVLTSPRAYNFKLCPE